MPFELNTGNNALLQASIINIPCGATANYQNIWGQGNYHEPDPAIISLSALDNHGIATIESQHTCLGTTATILATPNYGYHFTQWNDGNTDNPRTVIVTEDLTLSALFAPEIVPSICMVSVENDHNVLSWEKENPVSFYNIYCEGNTANEYELIATIPYSALSTYTDTTSRPRTRSYRYRLSATDIYGHEADLSEIHKTMHLTINQGVGNQWNLVWTEYEGTDYTTYIIYRGTNASNIQQLDVMPSGGYTSYTDVNAPEGDVYYQVGIMLSSPCNPTKSSYIVLSNMATNSTVGIKDHDFASSMTIYPNPTTGIVNVEWAMDNARTTTMEFHVYDAFGKLVDIANAGVYNMGICDTPQRTAQINLSRFVPGIYFIKAVSDGNVISIQKVVKQ